MTFVVYREESPDHAVPVMTATNLGRAKALARTLHEKTGRPYHVRKFRHFEGAWVASVTPEADPAVEVT